MPKVYDRNYIDELIRYGTEESPHLEYKGPDALGQSDGKKKEISKDVSSFANSDGGVIFYGISEFNEESKKHLPEKIDPIKRTDFSKEWLEHVINSNIQPKIKGLEITPIPITTEEVVYAVKIPKSDTVHMNKDKRYFKRYNFESVAMEDYEVKDVMNRARYPNVTLRFEIEQLISLHNSYVLPGIKSKDEGKIETNYYLKVYANNAGKVFANYINFFLYIPYSLANNSKYHIKTKIEIEGKELFVYSGDNTTKDVVDSKPTGMGSSNLVFGPSRYVPLLPGMERRFAEIRLCDDPVFDEEKITWQLHADNAEPTKGSIALSEIQIYIEDRTK